MEYFVGIGLAVTVVLFGKCSGFERDRAFYATLVIVVASYNCLFAAVGASASVIAQETAIMGLFVALAVVGFKRSSWLVAAALAGHGVLDIFHGHLVANPGVPAGWPAFCASFDVVAGGLWALRLLYSGGGQRGARENGAERPKKAASQSLSHLVDAEITKAREMASGDDAQDAFRHLERTHILGQSSTFHHVRVHIAMLGWSFRARDLGEALGQVFRIITAALFTPFGLVPRGNTGGARVNPFRPMPIPEDLARALSGARKGPRPVLFTMLALALVLHGADGLAAPSGAGAAQSESRELTYSVIGAGRPAVVFIPGLGASMATFKSVARDISKNATVITFDRSGYGQSAPAGAPRDARRADQELFDLLRQSGVPGPYILVGHSLGGLYAEYFAARHPEQVAGLILEESRPADFGRRCQVAVHTEPCTPTPDMVKTAPAGVQEDVAGLEAAFAQVEATEPNRTVPVLILSRPVGRSARPFLQIWAQAQNDLTVRYPGATHLTAPTGGHDIHSGQRAWFSKTVEAWIDRAVVRSSSPEGANP